MVLVQIMDFNIGKITFYFRKACEQLCMLQCHAPKWNVGSVNEVLEQEPELSLGLFHFQDCQEGEVLLNSLSGNH